MNEEYERVLEPPQPQGAAAPHRVTIHSPNLDGLVVVLVRRWRWILAVTLAFGVGTLVALPFLAEAYEVQARLLVKIGREQAPPSIAGSALQSVAVKRTEDVVSEIEILRSQAMIEKVVDAFGVDYFLARPEPQTLFQKIKAQARTVVVAVRDAFNEVLIWVGLEKRLTPYQKVVSTLQGSLRAEAVKRTDVMDVVLLASNPQAGVQVLTKLLDLYQAEHIRAYTTPGATDFLDRRVEELKAELARVEGQRRAFSVDHAVWDFDDQRRLLMQRLHEARTALSRTRQEEGRLRSEVGHFEATLKDLAREARVARVEQANPVAQNLQLRIVEKRAALAKVRMGFADDSRRVLDEEDEIRRLEELLAATQRSIGQSETFETPMARRDAERQLVEHRTRLSGVQTLLQQQSNDVVQIEADLARLDGLGAESRRLQRELALAEHRYQLYAKRKDEAAISDALDAARISNVAVIAQPVASVRPVRPRPMLLFLGALGAGLFGSIGWFLLRDAVRPVVHSRQQALAALGAPVLARMPEARS